MAIRQGDVPGTLDFGITEAIGRKLKLPEFGLSELFSDMLYRRNKSSSHNQQVLVVAV
jgi:hypothetical protein